MAANYRFSPSGAQISVGYNSMCWIIFDGSLTRLLPLNPRSYRPLTSEPEFPVEGQLAIADGTGWDPGSGAGTYIYRDSIWRKLD